MNARSNPFSSRHMESLAYQFTYMPLEDILERLKQLNYRAAIVGPEGSGKTTLLETIGARLRQDGLKLVRLRFDEQNKKLKRNFIKNTSENRIADHAFLVDGAEQLSWLAWKLLCLRTQKAGAVIITAHAASQLKTLVNTSTSASLLYSLVLKLVGKNEMIDPQEINRLFAAHQGNIRLALRELYDVWADKE